MNANPSLSRRSVLQSTGALVLAVTFGDTVDALAQTAAAGKPALLPTELDSWISLAPNGSVTLFFGKVDLGQGADIAMAQIVAEEMDLPLASISVVQGDSRLTCNQGGASGSTAIRMAGAAFRTAGAEARHVLLIRAAEKLGAPIENLVVNDGVVSVAGNTAKTISYAQLLSDGYFRTNLGWNKQYGNNLTLTGQAKPKSPDQYKIVGKPAARLDVPGRVLGTSPFVMDMRVKGMMHGRVIRPPAAGAVPVSVDPASIASIAGAQIVHKGDFIGVVADKEWNAVQAAQKLKVTWSNPPDAFPEMESLYDTLRQRPVEKAQTVTDKGKVDDVFAGAAHIVEGEYEWPFQSHACMGGACVLADVRADGATVWTGTQKPHFAAQGVAAITGLKPESVHAIWVVGPGSYGRNDAGDAALDAAVLSQAVGRPVRVQYSREQGTAWDPKGPPSVHKMRAALDANGKVIAWEMKIRGLSRLDVSPTEAKPGDTLAGQLLGFERANDPNFGSPEETYVFPNKRIAWETIAPFLAKASPLRTAHLRDPVGPQNHFASESFIDEVAAAAKADPVQFRLEHLTEERDVAVIKAVAERVKWKTGPAGTRRGAKGEWVTGQGIAYAGRSGVLMAMVADVEVNPKTGDMRVPRITVAHDCGLIINPQTLRNVIEGNVVQGLSRAIHEEVQFDTRKVTSVDWMSYPILDISEAPEIIDIVYINRPHENPGGAGEAAIRLVAASVNNAIFEATGRRIRRAPLTKERLRQLLA